jgi:hypothetical protein
MQCNHNYMNTEQSGAGPQEEPARGSRDSGPGEDDTEGMSPDNGDGEGDDDLHASADDVGAGDSPRERVRGWFAARLPGDWFTAVPVIQADREEIIVVGTLPDPETPPDAPDAERAAAAEDRVRQFREETRARRVEIAGEAEHRFRRKVSWGVTCAGRTEMFTTLSVPVMTRLRQAERRVLDTLVEGGVARSRSDALAWCVRLVGQHEDSWLDGLRAALRRVEEVRSEGPRA